MFDSFRNKCIEIYELDVFDSFRNECIEIYELGPAYFFFGTSICMAGVTIVELELRMDVDMYHT